MAKVSTSFEQNHNHLVEIPDFDVRAKALELSLEFWYKRGSRSSHSVEDVVAIAKTFEKYMKEE